MTMERKNKTKKIQVPKLNMKFGTTDNNAPKAVYIECSGFVSPKQFKESYVDDIKRIKHNIRKSTNTFVNRCELFKERFITNIEISVPGIREGKRSYIFIQAVFAQKAEEVISFNSLSDILNDDIKELAFKYAECMEDGGFKVYKSKN
jgi:hypothetical protein